MKLNLTAILCLLLIFLSACFSLPKRDRNERRALRKIAKARALYPDLFKKDTLVIRDTVTVESEAVDTITKVVFHDSITVVNNERVFLKYYYDTLRETIYHEVECKEVERIVTNEVIVEKVSNPTYYDQARPWFPFLWLLLALFVVSKLWRKYGIG